MVLKLAWAQKRMFWAFEKNILQIFATFLSDKVETIFPESKAKRSKLFKEKFGHRKLLRKWFWYYVELKNECSEPLKKAFSSFFKFLGKEVETVFRKKEAKC